MGVGLKVVRYFTPFRNECGSNLRVVESRAKNRTFDPPKLGEGWTKYLNKIMFHRRHNIWYTFDGQTLSGGRKQGAVLFRNIKTSK